MLNGRGPRERRTGRAVVRPSMVLFLTGVGLSLLVGHQAYTAARSSSAVVDGVLHDYARTAATYFEREARADLTQLVEHLFHPIHDVRVGVPRARPPLVDAVLHDPEQGHEACAFGDVGQVQTVWVFSTSGHGELVRGEPPPESARAAVLADVRNHNVLRRTEGITVVSHEEAKALVWSTVLLRNGDTLAYTLPLDATEMRGLFAGVMERATLLPETLMGGQPADSLLRVAVVAADGAPLFSSDPDGEPGAVATVPFEDGVGGGAGARVVMRAGAAEHLLLGDAPRARLPFLVAIILLSLILTGIGVRQMRREQEMARDRARFVANVSHELRTPLALQRIFLDMLLHEKVRSDTDRRWSLESIDRETHRLTQLVANVLQFSRLERDAMELHLERVELGDEVTAIVDRFRPLLDNGSTVTVTHNGPVAVMADREALGHAVTNLLENARRYGPGGQTIRVEVTTSSGTAVITVDDEGPGIPEEARAGVWRAFQRGEGADVAAKGGSGIGLAIVREIVEIHGGRAIIEEAPAGGARLRLELPRAPGSARVRAAENAGAMPAVLAEAGAGG